jgi:hypothetical protein
MVSLILLGHSAAALGPGDIAFTGCNGDGEDNLAFVALAPIPGSTDILLSDNEWNGGVIGVTGAFNDTAESVIKWTAPAGGLAAGTVVLINDIELTGPPLTTSTGSVAYVLSANVGVGASGEAFFAYVGNNQFPSNFLTVMVSGATTFAGNLNNTGLSFGTNAISVTPGTPDVMAYTGPRSGLPFFASYLPYLHNPTNWITEDGTGNQETNGIPPEVPFDTTPFTIAPVESAPRLNITALPGAVRLTWTTNATGYLLETNSALALSAGWGVLTSNYSVLNTNFAVTNAFDDAARFYRLRKP